MRLQDSGSPETLRRVTAGVAQLLEGSSKAFALTWYRALTWYFLGLSSPRTHFEPWKAVGTRGRAPLLPGNK